MENTPGAETIRARLGAWLTPALLVVFWFAPLPLDPVQQRLLAITMAVVSAWVTEVIPIPATAMLIGPAMIVAGICDKKAALSPYADPLLFLFYGAFFLAAALSRHGLDRRIAHGLVRSRLVGGIPWRTRAAMMAVGMLLSMWISNTASTAILVPILLGSLGAKTEREEGDPATSPALLGGLLAIAYACSIGGMGTLIGTPPNMITVRLLEKAGVELTFLDWSKIGIPVSLAIVALLYGVFHRIAPPGTEPRQEATESFGPMSRAEWIIASTFGLAVLAWVTPGVLKATESPLAEGVSRSLPAGAVAMLAAGVVFTLRDKPNGPAVLPWREARNVDWGLIMLFGGGISLGTQMFETGLARQLGVGFIELTGVSDIWTLTAVAIGFTIFFTEICSNTATSNMVVPLVIGVTSELGVSPIPPALGVGLAASCAFMMPIATGPNAIVYGTGHIPIVRMVRVGFVLNLLCGVVVFAILRVLCPLYGWV